MTQKFKSLEIFPFNLTICCPQSLHFSQTSILCNVSLRTNFDHTLIVEITLSLVQKSVPVVILSVLPLKIYLNDITNQYLNKGLKFNMHILQVYIQYGCLLLQLVNTNRKGFKYFSSVSVLHNLQEVLCIKSLTFS